MILMCDLFETLGFTDTIFCFRANNMQICNRQLKRRAPVCVNP